MTPSGVASACRKHRTKSLSALAVWDGSLVGGGGQAAVHADLAARRLFVNVLSRQFTWMVYTASHDTGKDRAGQLPFCD